MTTMVTTATDWAARITATWRQSIEAVIETGRLIAQAKAGLPHGEFLAMCETKLPFCARTAQMLMRIGADGRLSDAKYVSLLPAHWGTLHDITRLDDETFDARIEDGTINPDMERKDVPRPNGARSIMSSRQEPDDSLDYFPTPPWATRALIEKVFPATGNRSDSCWNKTCWEPACGEGHIADVLTEYFADVMSSDIHDYGYAEGLLDFLNYKPDPPTDWIITNPPFGDKTEQFVLHALECARIGVAMFVRLQWLETIGRYETIFRDHPPTVIAFFAERVNLCKGRWDPDGSTATAYIWLVWDKTQRQPRAPFWIPPGQREALTRPDDAARFTAHPVIKRESLPPHDPETGEIIEPPAGGDCGRIEPAPDALRPPPGAGSTSEFIGGRYLQSHPKELSDCAPHMGTVTEPAHEHCPAIGAGQPSVDPFEIPEFLRRKTA